MDLAAFRGDRDQQEGHKHAETHGGGQTQAQGGAEEDLGHVGVESIHGVILRLRFSTNPGQLFPDRHVDDAFGPESGFHGHQAGMIRDHRADDGRVPA